MKRIALALLGLLAALLVSGCAVGDTKPASDITDTGATLNGNVSNNQDAETSYWFRYGKTTAYGSETTHRSISISDRDAHAVSESVSGLDPQTTYHFKLCAQDSTPKAGPGCGRDQSFTTSDAPSAFDVTVADSGAWSWFGDPRAVYHEGARRQTYVGWIDALGAIRVASFDHDSRRTENVAIDEGFAVDDHSNPSLYVRPDGRLMAFWSGHGGPELFYRVTDRPEDITAWGPLERLSAQAPSSGYTYPNPVRIQEGLFLFWRGDDMKPMFSISQNEGENWSPARTLIRSDGWRPYVKYEQSGSDTIHFAFTEDHPGDAWGGSLTGIYYASYRDGSFYRADGTEIATMSSLPLTPSQADRVYDPTPSGVRSWIHDIAIDDGQPVIVYATLLSSSDHRYRYARWTGSAWEDHEIVAAGGSFEGSGWQGWYSGGIVLDHEDPSTVYLSRKVLGQFEIERWQTADGGATWSSTPITSGSTQKNVRPFTPRGSTSDDLDVFWMSGEYPSFTQFQTSLLARATAGWDLACSDGVDNDSDAKTDFSADPGCSSAGDNDETDL